MPSKLRLTADQKDIIKILNASLHQTRHPLIRHWSRQAGHWAVMITLFTRDRHTGL